MKVGNTSSKTSNKQPSHKGQVNIQGQIKDGGSLVVRLTIAGLICRDRPRVCLGCLCVGCLCVGCLCVGYLFVCVCVVMGGGGEGGEG